MLRPSRSPSAVRRVMLLVALGTAALAATPTPAHAWFGWLDKFSGPGPFKGLLFDVRLVCFGDASAASDVRRHRDDALTKARVLVDLANRSVSPDTSQLAELRRAYDEAQRAWAVLLARVDQADAAYFVTRPGAAAAIRTTMTPVTRAFMARAFDTYVATRGPEVQQTFDIEAFRRDVRDLQDEGGKAANAWYEQYSGAMIGLGGAGVEYSFCDADTQRRYAIELNTEFWWTKKGDDRFAGGERVFLSTLMPSLSLRPFTNPRWDIFDVGIGGGRYLFASKGFQDFSGWAFQPRFEVHGPTAWHAYARTDVRRLAAVLTVRVSFLRIPSGFDPGVFGPGSERIEPEWVRNLGLFLNANSLFR